MADCRRSRDDAAVIELYGDASVSIIRREVHRRAIPEETRVDRLMRDTAWFRIEGGRAKAACDAHARHFYASELYQLVRRNLSRLPEADRFYVEQLERCGLDWGHPDADHLPLLLGLPAGCQARVEIDLLSHLADYTDRPVVICRGAQRGAQLEAPDGGVRLSDEAVVELYAQAARDGAARHDGAIAAPFSCEVDAMPSAAARLLATDGWTIEIHRDPMSPEAFRRLSHAGAGGGTRREIVVGDRLVLESPLGVR